MSLGPITEALLISRGCRANDAARFAALFPNGGMPTVEDMIKAHEAGLDVPWLGVLLPGEAREELRARVRALFLEYKMAMRGAEVAFRNSMAHGPYGSQCEFEEQATHQLQENKHKAWKKFLAAQAGVLVEMLTATYRV
jgi:hypothetical protein